MFKLRKILKSLTATSPEIEGISSDFQRLSSELADDPKGTIVDHYAKYDTVLSYCNHFRNFLVSDRPRFTEETGVDLGCWLGLSTIVLHRLGAGTVHGLDVVDDFIVYANRFKNFLGFESVNFDVIPGKHTGRLPFEDNSVDWILSNDVFSFAQPKAQKHLISEASRILRPGGTFYLSDQNNPYCSSATQRVRASWEQFECRCDDVDGNIGVYVQQRMKMIANHIPEWQDDKTYTCALETAYCWGEQVLEYSSAIQRGDQMSSSCFELEGTRPPIHPVTGAAIGTFTDPVELECSLMDAGLEPELLFNLASPNTATREDDLKSCERFYLKGTKTGT